MIRKDKKQILFSIDAKGMKSKILNSLIYGPNHLYSVVLQASGSLLLLNMST